MSQTLTAKPRTQKLRNSTLTPRSEVTAMLREIAFVLRTTLRASGKDLDARLRTSAEAISPDARTNDERRMNREAKSCETRSCSESSSLSGSSHSSTCAAV